MQNIFISVYLISIILFYCAEEISTQAIAPRGYGLSPMVYSQTDDDLGMLLTILLLAGRNRNCNGKCEQSCCCNCCNCGDSSQSVPIPYPIPFPTNNPIINRRDQLYDDSDEDDDDEDEDDRDKYSEASNGSVKEVKSKVIKPDYKSGADNSVTIIEEVEVEQEAEEKVKANSKPKNN